MKEIELLRKFFPAIVKEMIKQVMKNDSITIEHLRTVLNNFLDNLKDLEKVEK